MIANRDEENLSIVLETFASLCVRSFFFFLGLGFLLIFFAFECENDEGDEAKEGEIHKKSLSHETN